MIVTTSDAVEGRRIKRVIGLVKGNAVRGKFFVQDWLAAIKNMIGGEIDEYTKLLAASREQAIDRMTEDARRQGANAVVAMRLTTASVMQGAAEILAYGTAVELE
jgi:uncharacterized protein YbjQ (UPF0145 family)